MSTVCFIIHTYQSASYKRQNTENTESGAIFYNLLRSLQIILGSKQIMVILYSVFSVFCVFCILSFITGRTSLETQHLNATKILQTLPPYTCTKSVWENCFGLFNYFWTVFHAFEVDFNNLSSCIAILN